MVFAMANYTITIKRCEEIFSPCSLEELCTQVCVRNAESIFFEQVTRDHWTLKKGTLPIFFEEVWRRYDHSAPEYLPMMLEIGRRVESGQIALKRIDMSNCKILNDNHLENLMRILPVSLAINNCPLLTHESFKIINKYGQNLVNLHLGTSAAHVIPTDLQDLIDGGSGVADGLLKTPNLVKLSMWGLKVNQYQHIHQKPSEGQREHNEDWNLIDFFEILTRAFAPNLVYLDISDCQVQNLCFLMRSKDTLRSLHLSNVLKHSFDRGTWGILENLGEIRFLDISQYNGFEWGPRPTGIPKQFLETLVNNMKKLEYLDKAGLRLVGVPVATNKMQGVNLLPSWESFGNDDIFQFLSDLRHYSHRRNGAYIAAILVVLLRRIKLGIPFLPLYSIADLVMEVLKNHEHPTIHVAGLQTLLETTKQEVVLGPFLRKRLFHLACHSMNKCFSHVLVTEGGVLLSSALSTGIPTWDPYFAKVMVATLLRAAKNAALTFSIDQSNSKRNILDRVPNIILENVDQLTASMITSLSLENDLCTLHCALSRMEHMRVVAERYGPVYLRFNPGGQVNLCDDDDHMLMEMLRAING